MAFPAVTSKEESDVVVTAMVLGLASDILKKKSFNMIAKDEAKLPSTKAAVVVANKALKTLGIKGLFDLGSAVSAPWKTGSYITGKQHGQGLPGSQMSGKIDYDDLTYQVVAQVTDRKAALDSGLVQASALYLGPGAYTGMLIVGGVAKYVGSTFQMKAIPAVKGAPIGDGKIKDMVKEILGGNVGYCHGMIQAAYAAAATAPKGITIEVAAGKSTTKMASCFGCTTFMVAVDRMPDGIHLGEAASWSPIDPNNEWAIHTLNERFLEDVDAPNPKRMAQLKQAVTNENKKWEKKCGEWLLAGTKIDKKLISDKHVKAWDDLCKLVTKEQPWSGTAFLNGLGFKCEGDQHGDDFNRVTRTLKA